MKQTVGFVDHYQQWRVRHPVDLSTWRLAVRKSLFFGVFSLLFGLYFAFLVSPLTFWHHCCLLCLETKRSKNSLDPSIDVFHIIIRHIPFHVNFTRLRKACVFLEKNRFKDGKIISWIWFDFHNIYHA